MPSAPQQERPQSKQPSLSKEENHKIPTTTSEMDKTPKQQEMPNSDSKSSNMEEQEETLFSLSNDCHGASPPPTPHDNAWRGASGPPIDNITFLQTPTLYSEHDKEETSTIQHQQQSNDEDGGTCQVCFPFVPKFVLDMARNVWSRIQNQAHGGAATTTSLESVSPNSIAPVPDKRTLSRHRRKHTGQRTLTENELEAWTTFAQKRNVSPPHKIRLSMHVVEVRANGLLRIADSNGDGEKYGRVKLSWNSLDDKEQAMFAFALNQGFDSMFPVEGEASDRNEWARELVRTICDQKYVPHKVLYNYIRKEGDMKEPNINPQEKYQVFLSENPDWQEGGDAFLLYNAHPEIAIILRLQEPWSMICAFQALATTIYLCARVRATNRDMAGAAENFGESDLVLNVSRFMRQGLTAKDQFQDIFCGLGGFTLDDVIQWLFATQDKRPDDVVEKIHIRWKHPRTIYRWALDELENGPILHSPCRLPSGWLWNETLTCPTEFNDNAHFFTIIGVRFVPTQQNPRDPNQVRFAIQDSLVEHPFREVSLKLLLDGGVNYLCSFMPGIKFPSELPRVTELRNRNVGATRAGASPRAAHTPTTPQQGQQTTPEISERTLQLIKHWFSRDEHVLEIDRSIIDNEHPTIDVDIPPCPLLEGGSNDDTWSDHTNAFDNGTEPSSYDEEDESDPAEC